MFLMSLISALLLFIPSIHAQAGFPPVQVWGVNQFNVSKPGTMCQFTNGASVQVTSDADYQSITANGTLLWSAFASQNIVPPPGQICPTNGSCEFVFEQGALHAFYDGILVFGSGTINRGMWLVCSEVPPWLWIVDGAGTVIWDTTSGGLSPPQNVVGGLGPA